MLTSTSINHQRLWETLMELRKIGAGSSESEGITRLSFSPLELKAKHFVANLMTDAGLNVTIDPIGNVIGKLEGRRPELPIVMTGSHVDTVIQGGPFDGALGVLGAIEAVRTLKENNEALERTIEVVSFSDEEGTRFGAGYIGSKALTGNLNEDFFNLVDREGISYREALIEAGYNPNQFRNAAREPGSIASYVEMHIEQGRVLEEAKVPVGIVTNIQGPVWLNVSLEGEADHAGATPMHIRHDASLAMAEAMLLVEKVAIAHQGVGTVGQLMVEPNGINIIPGRCVFTVDVRHGIELIRDKMVHEIEEGFKTIAKSRGVTIKINTTKKESPATCSPAITSLLSDVAKECGVRAIEMDCGAGHDSLIMSKVANIGMILVRSKFGISHNPLEWSSYEDCAAGTTVLLQTLKKLAKA